MPGKVPGHARAIAQRQGEPVAVAALPLAGDGDVHRHHQHADAGGPGAAQQVESRLDAHRDVELEPQMPVRHRGGGRLDGGRRRRAEDHGQVRRGSGTRDHQVGARPGEAGEPGRRDAEGRGPAPAEQLNIHLAECDIAADPRHQMDRGPGRLITHQCRLVLGAAVEVVKGEARNAPPRRLAHVGDGVTAPQRGASADPDRRRRRGHCRCVPRRHSHATSAASVTCTGRIISWSSWLRMWQCQT
jgi:hypothetical protein